MEQGDEIQIGVINENGAGQSEDGSGDQSEVIVNSKSSIDTVEKRTGKNYFKFGQFWMYANFYNIYRIPPLISSDSLILFSFGDSYIITHNL